MAYGVYGFGGGTYEPPSGGLLRGVQTGIGIFHQARQDQRAQEELDLRKEQAAQTMRHQEAQETRLQGESERRTAAEQRLTDKTTMDELAKNLQSAKDEAAGLMQQYGGKAADIPAAARAAAVTKVNQANELYNGHVRKMSAPLIKQFNDHVKQVSDDLASGRVSPDDVDPDTFYKSIVGATQRPVQDLVGQNGQPSLVQQAHDNIINGMQTHNMPQLYSGLDQFFAPELSKIKGKSTPMGIATGAKFLRLDPAPGSNDRVMPTLLVTTDLHPEGYAAPISEFRSSDSKNDPNIQTFRIPDIMERVGKTAMLSQYLSSDAGQQKLAQATPEAQGDVDKFLAALPHSTKDFKTQVVDLKNRKVMTTTGPGGNIVNQTDVGDVGMDPNTEARITSLETRQGVREAGLNARAGAAEAGRNARAAASETGKGERNTARITAKGGAGAKMTTAEANKRVESALGEYGIAKKKGEWKQWKGTGTPDSGQGRWVDLSPESEKIRARVEGQVADQMRAPPKAGGGAAPYPEGTRLRGKDGRTYVVQDGQPVAEEE